ncbi:MAG: hypothetical protein L6V82_02215 [Clostridiales bacterium]|nr:MAG: hypothetical protein L6V82_02215 [Clostridiales bacterium]
MNFNSRKIECKSPYGAVKCGEKLSLHFPIASWVSVDKMYVFIRLGDVSTPVEMRFEKSENGFRFIPPTTFSTRRGFIIIALK